MELAKINLSTQAMDAVFNLMLKVETTDKVRIRANKSLEQLLELLTHSLQSPHESVQLALSKFAAAINADQHIALKTLGVQLDVAGSSEQTTKAVGRTARVYRGQVIEPSSNDSVSRSATQDGGVEGSENVKPKKRVMYRGRETWV